MARKDEEKWTILSARWTIIMIKREEIDLSLPSSDWRILRIKEQDVWIPLYFDNGHIDLHRSNNSHRRGTRAEPIKIDVYEVIIVIITLPLISVVDEGAAGVMIINHCHGHARARERERTRRRRRKKGTERKNTQWDDKVSNRQRKRSRLYGYIAVLLLDSKHDD